MRAFVALEVDNPTVLDALVGAQMKLSSTGADLKLVERENLHFTLKFLGEVPDSLAEEAASRLKGLSSRGGKVSVEGVGAFPNPGRPRVLWAGVSPSDEGTVISIAGEVLSRLKGVGEDDQRGFKAHLTLARVRSDRGAQRLAAAIGELSSTKFGETNLASVKLKSSQLTSSGPVYRDVGVFPLA